MKLEKKVPCLSSKTMMLGLSEGRQAENLTSPDDMQAIALRRMFHALPKKKLKLRRGLTKGRLLPPHILTSYQNKIMGNARVHAYASGRVQGVFYRENTKRKAKELGITGWVRNLEDGRVEAVAEGEEEKVKELLDWIQEGPVAARVDNLEVNWEAYKGEFKEFEVRI